MLPLTPDAQKAVDELAQRYGLSSSVVLTLLLAVASGHGTMAQFSHPELGGPGQWMRNGMTMVGDMFNHRLKATVDELCNELALQLEQGRLLAPAAHARSSGNAAGGWWPPELGRPSSSGAQNNLRYAIFPETRRLAIDSGGTIVVYDTGDHLIGGVSQQQGGGAGGLSFSSQHGPIRLDELPIISSRSAAAATHAPPQAPPAASSDDVFAKIERLADMCQRGIVSEEEFAAKKKELLSRI